MVSVASSQNIDFGHNFDDFLEPFQAGRQKANSAM